MTIKLEKCLVRSFLTKGTETRNDTRRYIVLFTVVVTDYRHTEYERRVSVLILAYHIVASSNANY